MGNVAGEQCHALQHNVVHANLCIILQTQTDIKSHSLMMGGSNLAILIILTSYSPKFYEK